MRKAEIFFDAITDIREELIEEALDYRFTRQRTQWPRYLRNVACLALVVLVGFSAVRLGIFGGMGGSDSSGDTGYNNSTADTAAPENSNLGNGGAEDDAADDTADGNDSGDDSQAAEFVFRATVLAIEENYILVKPLDGESAPSSSDRVNVRVADVEDLPKLKWRDKVLITYTGLIEESYPPQITAISVKLLP